MSRDCIKHILAVLSALLLPLPPAASSSFNGYSEVFTTLNLYQSPDKIGSTEIAFPLDLGIIFDAQFDISDFVFIRTAFSSAASDVFPNAVPGMTGSDGTASFFVDEISASVNLFSMGRMSTISVFLGRTFEAAGTDAYRVKYLGVAPIASPLLQTRISPLGAMPLYASKGLGIAYHFRFIRPLVLSAAVTLPMGNKTSPLAAALEAAAAKDGSPISASKEILAFDLRAAMAGERNGKMAIADYSLGASLVTSSPFPIGGIYFAQTALMGNPYGFSFFYQVGISTDSGILTIVEPRWLFGTLHFNVTFFMLPGSASTFDNLTLLEFANPAIAGFGIDSPPWGLGLTFYKDPWYVGNFRAKLGVSIVGGLYTPDLDSLSVAAPTLLQLIHVQVTPYIFLTLPNGTFHLAATVDPLNSTPDPSAGAFVPDIISSIRIRVGYMVTF
jgi:hypothetical protein